METTVEHLERYGKFVKSQSAKYADLAKTDIISYVKKFTLGGSDAGIMLEVDPFTSRQMRMDRMLGKMEEQEDSYIFRRGHANEPFVASEFSLATGMTVIEGNTYNNSDYPWIQCHTDRTVVDQEFNIVPLEIKTISRNGKFNTSEYEWGKGCKFNDNGELLIEDDTIPAHYMAQCQLYMFMAMADHMYLAADIMTDSNGIRIYKIKRNEEIICRILVAMEDFIFNHVLENKDFPPQAAVELSPLAVNDKEMAVADKKLESLLTTYKAIDAELSELKEAKEDVSMQIKALLANSKGAVNSLGKTLCTYSQTVSRRFDSKALLNDHPEFSSYYKECAPSYVLRVK